MMNPCANCGREAHVSVAADSRAYMVCECGNSALYTAWNDSNPIPEPDPLAIAHEQLAECYELLDRIVGTSDYIEWDIRESVKALLAKHRSENA